MRLAPLACLAVVLLHALAAGEAEAARRARAAKLDREGNHQEAYDLYRALATDPATDARGVADDLPSAVHCLQRLNRVGEVDALIEAAVAAQPANWRLLGVAARTWLFGEHNGFIVAGRFQRGWQRNVSVTPSAATYQPGAKATVAIAVTDQDGKPFVGTAVLAIYDRSIDAIAGGSNVPEIKARFWKWRRHHHARSDSSADRFVRALLRKDERGMETLGVFGHLDADEADGDGAFQAIGGGGGARPMAANATPGAPMALAKAAGEPVGREEGAELRAGRSNDKTADTGALDLDDADLAPTAVRSTFADTALWRGSLTTGPDGTASVGLTMPENLGAWRVRLWALGHGARVGEAEAVVTTRKDVLVRVQTPRFAVERDEAVLSANVHNHLGEAVAARVALELDGGCLELVDQPLRTYQVPAGGEVRADWRVRVVKAGTATVRVRALTPRASDAMELRLPVKVHGALVHETIARAIRPGQESTGFTIRVPAERQVEHSRLEIRWSPTLAAALVDALPYLAEEANGSSENQLNRFLPTVIALRSLQKLGVDLAAVRAKRSAHDKDAQADPSLLGDAAGRVPGWERIAGRPGQRRNPVFDPAEVERLAQAGVAGLASMQLGDGGWGWFSGWGERSDAHTTASVLHGLHLARELGIAVPDGVLKRGQAWLARHRAEQWALIRQWEATKGTKGKPRADDLDALVERALTEAGQGDAAMRGRLYDDRVELSVYAKGLLGLALLKAKERDRLDMVLRNIAQVARHDDENQTAWLELGNQGYWWRWYGAEIEAHAIWLSLLAATEPKGDTAARLTRYLLANRRHATAWRSTRDTALVIEAMADFLNASGEARTGCQVEVLIDNTPVKQATITAADLFALDNVLVLSGAAVTSGDHRVEVRRRGDGPLYVAARLTTFSTAERIGAAGLDLRVERALYRLVPIAATTQASGAHGQVLTQAVEKYRREPLADDAEVTSGDLIEVELTVHAKNDFEHVVFEDFKPAGCEPVELRSGYLRTGLRAYAEWRDDRACLFARTLARGTHSVSYRLRAEAPGRFAALPTKAYGLYAPELAGNAGKTRLRIVER